MSTAMLDDVISRDVAARVQHVRRRRGGTWDRWVPPPADWREIVRTTWPGFVRHSLTRVPDGWVDLVLALADQMEGRGIVIFDAHEAKNGKLAFTHAVRGSQQIDADSSSILDHYEHLSAFICRECGRGGKPVHRGSGRMSTTRILCDRHEQGD